MPRKKYEDIDEKAPLKLRDRMIVAAVQSGELSKKAAAEQFGVSRTTVKYIFQRVKKAGPLIDKFNAVRSDIMTMNQIKLQEKRDLILDSVNAKEIKEADLKGKSAFLNVVGLEDGREFTKQRLLNDKSTENVAIIVMAINDAKKRLEVGNGNGD